MKNYKMKLKDKIKQEWNNLHKWVKIVVIILGLIFLVLLVLLLKFLFFSFGDWLGKILHI